MKKQFTNQVTISVQELNQAALNNGYNPIICDDTVSEAVLYLNKQSFANPDINIAKLIVNGANGKLDRKEIYDSVIDALDYFESHKLEINDNLAAMETVPTNIDGINTNDPLCLGAANKICLAQWQFESAMAVIAEWFEDLEEYLEY